MRENYPTLQEIIYDASEFDTIVFPQCRLFTLETSEYLPQNVPPK